jgi:pimeloyl-ACP methyl ester carboxylesterase
MYHPGSRSDNQMPSAAVRPFRGLHGQRILFAGLLATVCLMVAPLMVPASSASASVRGQSVGAGSSLEGEPNAAWHPCSTSAEVECSRLQVPIDWSHAQGPKLRVALARLPATNPKHRIGSLLFNCGGPGCPTAQVIKTFKGSGFTDRLRARFDLVGWDPRGIGESQPLQCGRPWFHSGADVYPSTLEAFKRLVSRNRALARSCRRLSGPLVNNVGARSTVRDMEAIRKALGGDGLNYLGLSYGTMLGALYAQRYPERVRALALDGALDPSLSQPVMLANEASSAEDVFERWAAWCEATPSCPLYGQDVTEAYDNLIAAANQSPIPAPELGPEIRVSGEEIQYSTGANYLLFEQPTALFPEAPSWHDLGPAIVKAQQGDASYFGTNAPGPPGDPQYGAIAVECLDFSSQVRSYADLRDYGILASDVSQHLGGASQTGEIASQCVGWPRPKPRPRRIFRARGAPPTLIVNATHDPSTTYEWALSLHAQIKPSRLLTRMGNGHTSYTVSPCARRFVDAYLIDRELPPRGATCSP